MCLGVVAPTEVIAREKRIIDKQKGSFLMPKAMANSS
jgi:hypothetical protein